MAFVIMKDMPLWLSTALGVGGLALAVALHFAWHPLRRHFSDAFDVLRTHKRLFWLVALALFLNGVTPPAGPAPQSLHAWLQTDLASLATVAVPMLLAATESYARMWHQLVPPWPVALAVPVALVAGTASLIRYPYRYGGGKLKRSETTLLMLLAVGAVVWAFMGLISLGQTRASPVQPVWQAASILFEGLTTAVVQTWMVRVVLAWETPGSVHAEHDAPGALRGCLMRWRPVLALAAFNVIWMVLAVWRPLEPGQPGWIALREFLLFFAPLPIAVAASDGGSFLHCGGAALRALFRSLLPLLGHGTSCLVVLALAHYALAVTDAMLAGESWQPLATAAARAFVLATILNWLFLAGVLIVLRYGFAPITQENSTAPGTPI